MKRDFIPRPNSNLSTFTGTFINLITKHKEVLGLSSAEMNEVKSVLSEHRKLFSKMVSLKAQSKSATEEHSLSRKKTEALIRRISMQIKTSKKYTPDIGEEFGIINRFTPVSDFSGHKPKIKAKDKRGFCDYQLYKKRS